MSDFYGVGQEFKPDEPRMGPNEVDNLVVYLLAYPRVAQAALADLVPEYFSAEPHYRILWSTMQGLIATYGVGAVPFDAAYMTVGSAVDSAATPLPISAWYQVMATPEHVGAEMIAGDSASIVQHPGVLYYAYKDFEAADASPDYGLDLLRRFVHERGVLDAAVRIGSRAVDRRPGNFDEALKRLVDLQGRVESIGTPLVHSFDEFPEDVEPVPVFSTGVSYLDYFLNGGHAGGEVYLLIGPQKAGKSFHASQIACASAQRFVRNAEAGAPLRHAYLATYELSFKEFKSRFYACGADVSQSRYLNEISKSKGIDYTTRGNLLPYEHDLYRDKKMFDFDRLPGERERIEEFMAGTGRAAHVFDMTGKDGARGRGYGGVEELAAMMRQLDAEGRKPGVLVVDYLHKAVRRQLDYAGKDPLKYLRPYLMDFVVKAIDKIAVPYDIPVWLLAQYSAEGQEARPTKKMKITNASEVKTLGENCNAAICMGTVDEESKVLQVTLDLCRRSDKAGKSRLAKLDYEMARFRDVTGMYDVDENNGCFTPKDAAAAAAGASVSIALPSDPAPPFDPYTAEAALPPPSPQSDEPY